MKYLLLLLACFIFIGADCEYECPPRTTYNTTETINGCWTTTASNGRVWESCYKENKCHLTERQN